jgi:hypothetical protein
VYVHLHDGEQDEWPDKGLPCGHAKNHGNLIKFLYLTILSIFTFKINSDLGHCNIHSLSKIIADLQGSTTIVKIQTLQYS